MSRNKHSSTSLLTTVSSDQSARRPGRRRVTWPHPSGFDQFSSELFGGVVEGELLTAQVVDWRVSLQVKEEVVVEAHFSGLLLEKQNTTAFATRRMRLGEQAGRAGAAGAFPAPAMEEVQGHPDTLPHLVFEVNLYRHEEARVARLLHFVRRLLAHCTQK